MLGASEKEILVPGISFSSGMDLNVWEAREGEELSFGLTVKHANYKTKYCMLHMTWGADAELMPD